MRTLLGIAGAGALLAFAYLCITLAFAARTVASHASSLVMKAGDTLTKVNLELDEMHRLTLEAGLTAMEARKASAKESAYLDIWNSRISNTLEDADAVLAQTAVTVQAIQGTSNAATRAIKSTQDTVTALQAPIAQATATLQAAQAATQHLDALVSDPTIKETIAHTDATMAHVDATTGEVQQAVHHYFNPTLPEKIWGWVREGAVTVGEIFLP